MLADAKVFVEETWRGKSVYRTCMNLALREHVQLDGVVLDIGSGDGASYGRFMRGRPSRLVRLDGRLAYRPDIVASLEEALPVRPRSFDQVVAMNILEHVFLHEKLLAGVFDALEDGGRLVLCVPFMKEVHSDPEDYFRYTASSLLRITQSAGFRDVVIRPFGGLFLVAADVLVPAFRYRPLKAMAVLAFLGLNWLAERVLLPARNQETYVLGYLVVAEKSR